LELIEGPRPPDYITITDDMLDEIQCFKGDNIRVQLNNDYSKDELLRIKKTLEDAGANHVKLNKMKEEKIDLESGVKNNLSLYSPEDLFNQWVEYDNPKNLNISLLKKLNQEIIKE